MLVLTRLRVVWFRDVGCFGRPSFMVVSGVENEPTFHTSHSPTPRSSPHTHLPPLHHTMSVRGRCSPTRHARCVLLSQSGKIPHVNWLSVSRLLGVMLVLVRDVYVDAGVVMVRTLEQMDQPPFIPRERCPSKRRGGSPQTYAVAEGKNDVKNLHGRMCWETY